MGDRDREKGDRDRLAGAWLAGWTREAEREASKAVTAVAIEVAVVACCPTSEQARPGRMRLSSEHGAAVR